jgi:hypothetical protein
VTGVQTCALPISNGGTISTVIENGIRYRVHTFTSSGTLSVLSAGKVEVLAVAGGGGGSGNPVNNFRSAGGGGGGGLIYNTDYSVTTGNKTITVGAGGTGSQNTGTNGENSVFDDLTAFGGGAGGSTTHGTTVNGANGGSGGGGGDYNGNGGTGTPGQGFNGGNSRQANGSGAGASGAGGGGAGGPGPDSINTYRAISGGLGKTLTVNGSSVIYAAGGGSRAASLDNSAGVSGAENSGTGGMGARFNTGGNGGSGIVIIRYRI